MFERDRASIDADFARLLWDSTTGFERGAGFDMISTPSPIADQILGLLKGHVANSDYAYGLFQRMVSVPGMAPERRAGLLHLFAETVKELAEAPAVEQRRFVNLVNGLRQMLRGSFTQPFRIPEVKKAIHLVRAFDRKYVRPHRSSTLSERVTFAQLDNTP